jgi:hypothetical protein
MFNCALLGKSLCCYVDEREARWSYEKILGGVGRSSLATPDLRWEMVLRLVSSLIYGVGICPLKTIWHWAKILMLRLTWRF